MSWRKLFNPVPEVGALEISDLSIRFLRIENNKLRQAVVQLPPGIVSGGKIIDRLKMFKALQGLHQQIDSLKNSLHVVLVLPAGNVYTQYFTMPLFSGKSRRETAELNLQMIAPIDIRSSYYGYEMIGETKQGQLEALGAFTNAQDVDDFVATLKDANFKVVAVEFPGLSLARLIREYGVGLKPEKSYLVINLSPDGPDLMLIKNNHIYFNYYNSWTAIQQEIGGRKLTAQEVKDFLARQIKQVINFYASRSASPINDVVLINNPISQEIIKMLRENFSLNAQLLTIGKFNQLPTIWYSVLGAALRGIIKRSEDKNLTLAKPGLEKEYYQDLSLNFIKVWRNIILFALGFMLLVLLAANYFLMRSSALLAEVLSSPTLTPLNEIQDLQNSAKKFNQSLDLALSAQELSQPWSPLLEKLRLLAGSKISLDRLFVDQSLAAFIIGKAANDSAAVDFKNSMEQQSNFQDVVLPLSNITANKDGTASFNLRFKISSFRF